MSYIVRADIGSPYCRDKGIQAVYEGAMYLCDSGLNMDLLLNSNFNICNIFVHGTCCMFVLAYMNTII